MASMHTALLQKNKISMRLLRHPEIVGVGIGHADPQRPDRGGAILLYTHKNIVTAEVNKAVTKLMETRVPIRIIQSGPFRRQPAIAVKKRMNLKGKMARQKRKAFASQIVPQRKHRPVPGGVSIGRLTSPNTAEIGTAGLITIRNKEYFILTNNHVAIRNNQFTADIYQPGPFEAGGSFNAADFIGRPSLYVPLRDGQVNFMDAAIVRGIPNDSLFNPRYLRPFAFGRRWIPIALPGHLNAVRVGENLYKTGRTTGFTIGTVEAINQDQKVTGYDFGDGTLFFRNQVIIRGRSAAGDSGSVWLRSGNNYAAALHFAGGEGRAVATPIATVMNTFGMLVAAPSSSGKLRGGIIRRNRVKGDYSYSQPLSAELRKRIRVVRPK